MIPSTDPVRPARRVRRLRVLLGALGALAVAAIVVGAVDGARTQGSDTPTQAATRVASIGGGRDGDRVVGAREIVPLAAHGTAFRFRLAHGGERLHPDAADFAGRTGSTGPLLLFLPATGAVPGDYREFLGTAASLGYHVLGLDYWNEGRSVTRTCLADAHCYTEVQRNRLFGNADNRFSRVNAPNSVLGRLHGALRYLARHDPHGGWNHYLAGGRIDWAHIVVAGHSQGGGESAYIAHKFRVQGVLMFSSPVDTFDGVAASWMKVSGATPASRMYAFDDAHDMYYHRIVGSWSRMGLGRADRVRSGAVPTGAHRLISTADIGTPHQSHGRSVGDGTPRTAAGVPRFEPTWRWMLTQTLHTAPSPGRLIEPATN